MYRLYPLVLLRLLNPALCLHTTQLHRPLDILLDFLHPTTSLPPVKMIPVPALP